jgi:deoxyribodipyrimidine photo-lyase
VSASVESSTTAGVRSIKGGEPEALRRVRAYVDETGRADAQSLSRKTRVSAHLGADFSCRISPWLALGCVSPRRIYQELSKVALQPELLAKSATYFELVWRDFFRFITCKYSERRVGAKSVANAASSAWSPAGAKTGAMAL